jgi:hypothetical protein
MAESLFGNIFDVDTDIQSAREKSALNLAQLSPGRVQVAGAGMAGGMLGKAGMEGLGYKTPQQQKEEAVLKVQSQFPNPQTAEQFRQIGNALMNIDPDRAKMAFDQADDITTKATSLNKKGTHEKRLDTAASLTPCVAASGGDWRLASRECQIEVELKANELKNEDPNIGIGAKLVGERLPYYIETADLARADIRQIREMERILNKGIYTGIGGEAFTSAGKFFGQDVADKELFASLSKERALAYTEKTKGAISDKEMDLFLSAATSLSKSEGGNRLLLKYSKLFSQQVIKLKSFVMNWRIKNPRLGLASLEVAVDDWRNNPDNELGIATDPVFIELSKAGKITETDAAYSDNKKKLELLKQEK